MDDLVIAAHVDRSRKFPRAQTQTFPRRTIKVPAEVFLARRAGRHVSRATTGQGHRTSALSLSNAWRRSSRCTALRYSGLTECGTKTPFSLRRFSSTLFNRLVKRKTKLICARDFFGRMVMSRSPLPDHEFPSFPSSHASLVLCVFE